MKLMKALNHPAPKAPKAVLFFILIAAILPLSSHAKRFSNQFVEFELPPKWECGLEGSEWVCQSSSKNKSHEAIVVLAAKHKGRQDSLDQYKTYLQREKAFTLPGGRTIESDPKYAKYTKVNGHAWVDSLHLSSEIPGFYTRYLATVKKDIAVLVTYSVQKDKWQGYQPEFDTLVDSLKVFRKPGGFNSSGSKEQGLFPTTPRGNLGSTGLGGNTGSTAPVSSSSQQKSTQSQDATGSSNDLLILFGLLAVVVFVIVKKRRG
jgi:hypothetical protein